MSVHPTLNEHYRQKFGCKVYKLALDAGFTCPNRDGTLDTRGCVFCSAYGGGEFAQGRCESVARQLEKAKSRVAAKVGRGKYIAYFQSFTNTYAPVQTLEVLRNYGRINHGLWRKLDTLRQYHSLSLHDVNMAVSQEMCDLAKDVLTELEKKK